MFASADVQFRSQSREGASRQQKERDERHLAGEDLAREEVENQEEDDGFYSRHDEQGKGRRAEQQEEGDRQIRLQRSHVVLSVKEDGMRAMPQDVVGHQPDNRLVAIEIRPAMRRKNQPAKRGERQDERD